MLPKQLPGSANPKSIKRYTKTNPCKFCKKSFPAEGLERVLPVLSRRYGVVGTKVFLCLDCRRKEFAINSESYPPTVESYMDTAYGGRIVPRINENEARLQYCLEDDQFRNLHHTVVRAVKTSRDPYEVRLYDEKAILKQARWIHGGDIGIANARQVFAEQGQRVELPPVGPVLERRNKIRQAFLMRKVYASSMLPQVRDYVKTGRGNFEEIVDTLAI
ncbi:MAG: hypothetical protein JOS17DRAFT_789704 [Linnemannia elongata]|nr:MAG: hypothetical protein JOS17DRAFT_789704 [Linnemannia elongata]